MSKAFFSLYIIFLLFFSIFSYLFVDPNFIYLKSAYSGFSLSYRFLTTLIYISLISLFFIFYFLFLLKIKNKEFKQSSLKKVLTAAVIILLFAYPAMLSYDIFNYAFTAKVLFFYHENPYIVMPIEFTGDPLLLFTRAANKIALYGPSWVLLTVIPYYLGSVLNFLTILFSFKLFAALFYMGTAVLIWKMSKSVRSVCLFALNPLVLIETAVSGHNDIVMVFFALLSFLLLSKNKLGFAILLFLLSVFIKYATLFLFPVFLYVLFRKIRKQDVDWGKTFYYSSLLMIVAFFLSSIREEIYPWYAIWFLPLTFFVLKNKILLYFSVSISLGLMLSYVPFMLSGTYFGLTPLIKLTVIFTPVILTLAILSIKEKLWLRILPR